MPKKSRWYKSRTIQGVILGAILSTAGVIFVNWLTSKEPPPEFHLVKGASYHPDSALVVQAINAAAAKNKRLDFDIDGYWFKGIAPPLRVGDSLFWRIILPQVGLPDTMRHDGEKVVCFGFSRGRLSTPMKIYFDSRPPQAYVGYAGRQAGEKTIFGKVMDEGAAIEQPVSVEVSFRHHERLRTLQLPVRELIDASGRRLFEFEYQVQNFPQYAETDFEYQQPYFQLSVKDAAGNEFRQESTYNAFIVAGEQRFGYREAQILLQKYDPERMPARASAERAGQSSPVKGTAEVSSFLVLRVVIRAHDYVQLRWNRLPSHLAGEVEEYSVLRSNRVIGASFDTTFTDRTIAPDSSYRYQVVAHGKGGTTYASNVVSTAALPDSTQDKSQLADSAAPVSKRTELPGSTALPQASYDFQALFSFLVIFGVFVLLFELVDRQVWAKRIQKEIQSQSPRGAKPSHSAPITLRSKPRGIYSLGAIRAMLKRREFFDVFINKQGPGLQHDYKTIELNGEVLVIDYATGLMWQQRESAKTMNFAGARKHIEQLNREKFAGFSDWRLPTLEEIMSLMEPKLRENHLYIDPIFDVRQPWVWTADKEPLGGARVVYFDFGSVLFQGIVAFNFSVRAVRSGQS